MAGGIRINAGGQPPRKTLPASVEDKGKKPIKLTPAETAALDKKIAKTEAKQLEAAKRNSIETRKQELNKAAGIGTSGAQETPSASPKAHLSRSSSDLHSTGSFGTANSSGSLAPTPPDSPLPSWIGDRTPSDLSRTSSGFSHDIAIPGTPTSPGWPATRPGPMNFEGGLSSPTSSEGSIVPYGRSYSDPGHSGSPSSSSNEASTHPSPVNWGDIHNFRIRNQNHNTTEGFQTGGFSPGRIVHEEGANDTIHPRWKPPAFNQPVDIPPLRPGSPLNWDDMPVNVKSEIPPPGTPRVGPDPSRHTGHLNDPVSMPGTPSSPGTPATRPGPGPLTFPDSPSSLSSQSSISSTPSDHELPVTHHAQPRPPEKQDALGNLSTKAKLGIAAATGLVAGAIITEALTQNGNSSQSPTNI